MRRRWIAACLACLLPGAAAWALGPGDVAPDFAISDLGGKPLRLAEFRGKVVLVNFWASWCGPCLEEMPRLSDWQRKYGAAGLQVIGISMDDDAAPVVRLLAKHPVEYPIGLGDAPLGARYGGILGLPQSFLIDRQGVVLARYKSDVDLSKLELAITSKLFPPGHDDRRASH
jgi:thiol-disulfide isomerase/thioredoxin